MTTSKLIWRGNPLKLLIVTSGILFAVLLVAIIARLAFHQDTPTDPIDPGLRDLNRAKESFGSTRKGAYEFLTQFDWSLDRLDLNTTGEGVQGLIYVFAGELNREIEAKITDPDNQWPQFKGRSRDYAIARLQDETMLEMYRMQFNPDRGMKRCGGSGYCEPLSAANDLAMLYLRWAALDHLLVLRAIDHKDPREIIQGAITTIGHYRVDRNRFMGAKGLPLDVQTLDDEWRNSIEAIEVRSGAQ